ncbi:MAG: hypothetical protein ACXWQO_12840 [Bdellovibrionota bacterium]
MAFRFYWPLDIEMKFDEAETFNFVRDWKRGDIAFPWVGQSSSNGLRHPGLGIWLFLIYGKLFFVETLVDLARVPPILAAANFLLLSLFAWFGLHGRARLNLFWALALMAVNPFLVLLDRKLWHPSVMGLFVSGFYIGWLKRASNWGSFFFGLFFLLPGQIHMSGFFLALGFVICDLIYNRREFFRTVRWPAFMGGFVIGFLPLIPWIYWLIEDLGKGGKVSSTIGRLCNFKFPNFWFSNAFGVIATYPFGTEIFGRNILYALAMIICSLIMLVGGILFLRRAWRFLRRRERSSQSQIELFSFFGTGAIATISLMDISRYFTLCLGFIPYLSAVRSLMLLKRGRQLLVGLIVVQAVASACVLFYIHNNSRIINDEGRVVGRPLGVFGMPVRECGDCTELKFERISGGYEIIKLK